MSIKDLTNEQLIEYHSMFKLGLSKSKRFESRKIHNADVKFMYHIVRLIYEVEMILKEGDLDLRRNREHMKAIRRGEVPLAEISDWFNRKERALEKLYEESNAIPDRKETNFPQIKQLLLDCLEHHYGSLEEAIVNPDKDTATVQEIANILKRGGYV